MQARDLATHGDAHLSIEIRERLIEEECLRLADDCSSQCDALALTTREIPRLAFQIFVESQRRRSSLHSLVDLGARHVLELEREAEVLAYRHVRIECVVLEDHRDVARLGRNIVDDAIADLDGAGADRLEAGDHAQRSAFPASRWSDQHHKFSVFHIEIDAIDRYLLCTFSIDFADALEFHSRHTTSSTRRCCR